MSGLVDVEVLSYIRPDDGFRKYMLDMAPVRCEFLFDAQLVLSRNSHPTGTVRVNRLRFKPVFSDKAIAGCICPIQLL